MDLQEIFSASQRIQEFKEGMVIFEKGMEAYVMYVIIEGEVEIIIEEKVIQVAEAGTIFGEMAIIENGRRRSATARAKKHCRLVSLDRYQFLALIKEEPHFALYVMQVLAKRLREMNYKIADKLLDEKIDAILK